MSRLVEGILADRHGIGLPHRWRNGGQNASWRQLKQERSRPGGRDKSLTGATSPVVAAAARDVQLVALLLSLSVQGERSYCVGRRCDFRPTSPPSADEIPERMTAPRLLAAYRTDGTTVPAGLLLLSHLEVYAQGFRSRWALPASKMKKAPAQMVWCGKRTPAASTRGEVA